MDPRQLPLAAPSAAQAVAAGRDPALLVIIAEEVLATGHAAPWVAHLRYPGWRRLVRELSQEGGGALEGRAIPTLGYRGMHSSELSFDNWRVPHANLIGGDDGIGRGFAL